MQNITIDVLLRRQFSSSASIVIFTLKKISPIFVLWLLVLQANHVHAQEKTVYDVQNLKLDETTADGIISFQDIVPHLIGVAELRKHVYENQLAGGGGSPAAADIAAVISLVDQITADGYELQAGYFDIFRNTADSETIWFTESSAENLIYAPLHLNQFGLAGGGG